MLLDGWEEQSFDKEIALTPDPALEAARSALESGTGLDDALAVVERQIALAAPALRGARYDLIAIARSELEVTADLLRRMLCDLHLAAFRIQRRLGAVTEARAQLMRAGRRAAAAARRKAAAGPKAGQPAPSGRPAALAPEVADRIRTERAAGRSLAEIARELNATGTPTAHGGAQWWPSTVRAVIGRTHA